jgi:hypothetical protein
MGAPNVVPHLAGEEFGARDAAIPCGSCGLGHPPLRWDGLRCCGVSQRRVGLVGVVSGVPIRVGLVVTVVGSPKADVGPATFWDPTPVSGSLRRLGCLRVASWLGSF